MEGVGREKEKRGERIENECFMEGGGVESDGYSKQTLFLG